MQRGKLKKGQIHGAKRAFITLQKLCIASIMKKLFCNCKVFTGDENAITDGAVLTTDGVITSVGSKAALLNDVDGETEIFDLSGGILAPAFIDAHSHLSEVAFSYLKLNLNGAETKEDVKKAVEDYIAESGKSGLIQASGYSGEALDKAFLDEISGGRELLISHSSGHSGYFNTASSKTLGINSESGYLTENEYFEKIRLVGIPAIDDIKGAYLKAQKKYFSNGISTVQDGYFTREMIPIYKALMGSGAFIADTVIYSEVSSFNDVKNELSLTAGEYKNHIKLGGMKIFLDGSPQIKTAWMREPYEGETEFRGSGTMSNSDVKEAMILAAQNKVQLLAHCNGDAAAEQFLRCAEAVAKVYPIIKELRFVIIHAQFLPVEYMQRLKALGIIPSFFISHIYNFGDIHIKNTGYLRASSISPAGSALKNGLVFTFHQDSPVLEPDVIEGVKNAVIRKTKGGVLLGENEKISFENALEAITSNAAFQYFEEKEKGKIAPRKRADFAVISSDALSSPESAEVKMLFIGSELVYTK